MSRPIMWKEIMTAKNLDQVKSLWKELKKQQRVINPNPKDKNCPICSNGVHFKVIESTNETLKICHNCGWKTFVPFIMDEGRELSTRYNPGFTGRPRGRLKITMKPGEGLKVEEVFKR